MAASAAGFAETVKSIGVGLATASGVAYACGYLARRARARALGLDPGFVLVDEAYVFAGFRFVLLTLLALLVAIPLLLAAHAVARRLSTMLRPGAHAAAERLCAFVLALATLGLFTMTLEVKDALLRPASGLLSVALRDAVLGRNAVGVAITIIATALAACAVYWVGVRWAAGGANALTLVLGVLVTLLLFLLPIQQGVFWADRFVRVLERAPDENAATASPVWLVDRSRDKVVLLVRDAAKKPKLVTFGADKLDGIAVTGTSSLDQLVGSLERP